MWRELAWFRLFCALYMCVGNMGIPYMVLHYGCLCWVRTRERSPRQLFLGGSPTMGNDHRVRWCNRGRGHGDPLPRFRLGNAILCFYVSSRRGAWSILMVGPRHQFIWSFRGPYFLWNMTPPCGRCNNGHDHHGNWGESDHFKYNLSAKLWFRIPYHVRESFWPLEL